MRFFQVLQTSLSENCKRNEKQRKNGFVANHASIREMIDFILLR